MTDFLISLKRSMIATFPFTKRLIDTTTSDRCDNAKLGKMRSDRIYHGSLLIPTKRRRVFGHGGKLSADADRHRLGGWAWR
jgi:hypothetical protein